MAGLQDSLREIHRLRKLARDLQAEIDRIPIQLKARNNLVAKNEASLKDAQDTLKKVKVGVLEKESSLKTSHQSIARRAPTASAMAPPNSENNAFGIVVMTTANAVHSAEPVAR